MPLILASCRLTLYEAQRPPQAANRPTRTAAGAIKGNRSFSVKKNHLKIRTETLVSSFSTLRIFALPTTL